MSATSDPMDLTQLSASTIPTSPTNVLPTDARFWARVYANLIDFSILSTFTYIFIFVINNIFTYYQYTYLQMYATLESNISLSSQIFGIIFGFLLQLIYYNYYLSSSDQATPGMKYHGLKLVDAQGMRVTLGRVLLRELVSIISFWFLFLGYLMILMTKRRQALHDLVTSTYVQDTSEPSNIDAVLLQHYQSYNHGGFWRRLGATITDNIITISFATIVTIMAVFVLKTDQETLEIFSLMTNYKYSTLIYLMFFIFPMLYSIYFDSSKYQGTPGKILFSLKVSDYDGNRLTVFKSFIYYCSYQYSILTFFIGFIMVAFTKRKQGFHNKISRTYVIHVPKKSKLKIQ